ncbi:MAG: hypothetical protein ACYDDU_15000 [Dermatophilaceae bacterium]
MSVTSFGDMVIEAERVLTQLAATRDVSAPALATAWPDFCRRAIHAITAATGARDPRWYAVDLLVVEAARPVRAALRRRGLGAAAAPDPVLERAGVLLGAAGDILASAPRDSVADPMLADVNIRAAQGRVAALLAAGAHTAVRALASHADDSILSRDSARQLAGAAMRIEQLATRVFEATPRTASRADDVAVATPRLDGGPLTLAEAIEQWGREARDTVRSTTPSARDLQGLAADLARLATHSRAILRAAVGEKLIDDGQGQCIDKALAESAAGWLEIAERWTGFHTVQPPTPSKIAVSHALGQALIAVTRDGRQWADPADLAARVDLTAALAAVRRAMDVARDVVERQSGLPERLAESGHLFAPAALLAPSVERLHARLRPGLAPIGVGDATDLAGSVSRQPGTASVAARLLDATARVKPPSLAEHTPAARSSGLAFM